MPSPLQISQESYSPIHSSTLSQTASLSASSHGRFTHDPPSKSICDALSSETITSEIHASKSITSISRTVNTPVPAEITELSNV